MCYSQDLIDVLKGNGYQTALCGKNHTYRNPSDFDFHECNSHLGAGVETNYTQEDEAFCTYLNQTRHMEMHSPSPGGVEVQFPYRNVTSALKFLDQRDPAKPFFLWVSFAEPHNPYQVPEPYFNLFPPEMLPPLRAGKEALLLKGPSWEWERAGWERIMGQDIEERILRTRSNYHGMLRLIDDQFKRLMNGLNERNLRDKTIVVFLSDHGDFAGEYGLIRKGVELPEVLTRITMAWQGPGILHHKIDSHSCVNLVDILPTLCDWIDAKIPFGVQGRSLKPLLTGKPYPQKEFETAYSECGYGGLYWNANDTIRS